MTGFAISGVHAAVLTPFETDGTPDVARLARLCRWLLGRGCDGLVVLGSTGEANSLSVGERLALIDGVAAAGLPGSALVVGVGSCAVPDTVQLTRAALTAGAGAVLMSPPFYYKGVGDDGLFAFLAAVVDRVGDPRLRVVLYHYPQLSGVPIGAELIERLRVAFPDTFVALKDSAGDLAATVATIGRFPDLAVMSGADDLFWPVLQAGGAGCITAVANVASPLAGAVWSAARRGDADTAALAHGPLAAVRRVFTAYPFSAALKAAFAHQTRDATWARLRPPLMPLEPSAAAALAAALDRLPTPVFRPGDAEDL